MGVAPSLNFFKNVDSINLRMFYWSPFRLNYQWSVVRPGSHYSSWLVHIRIPIWLAKYRCFKLAIPNSTRTGDMPN